MDAKGYATIEDSAPRNSFDHRLAVLNLNYVAKAEIDQSSAFNVACHIVCEDVASGDLRPHQRQAQFVVNEAECVGCNSARSCAGRGRITLVIRHRASIPHWARLRATAGNWTAHRTTAVHASAAE